MPAFELNIYLFPRVPNLIPDLDERIIAANCQDDKNNDESKNNKNEH
jgi:hypothetical protein